MNNGLRFAEEASVLWSIRGWPCETVASLGMMQSIAVQHATPPAMAQGSYRDTLNLPETSFGMRANATQREPELQRVWADRKIYEQLSRNNTGEPFTLHDGPPYANGALHMGHALNKVLKDIINKYQLLRGRKARFVPGWDCHGLPIELKVLQGLDPTQRAALTPLELRRKAVAYAEEQIERQKAGFKRWGIWGDWDQPYLTMQKAYEAAQIDVFGQMVLKGHIYRGLKPVHWSPSSRTALAEAELEYPDGHVSPSVYVLLKVRELPEGSELAEQLEAGGAACNGGLHLAVWTTTPWTLPANVAVAVNPALGYTLAELEDGRRLIVARERLADLAAVAKGKDNNEGSNDDQTDREYKVLRVLSGVELEGIVYDRPLLGGTGRVVRGGDWVTAESGTGLVHMAPGHGAEDFLVAQREQLPVLCPVNEAGIFTAEAGDFAGLDVLSGANDAIIEALERPVPGEQHGALLALSPYRHRYPYDWRTKKPTIFRATEQWFASLQGFRDAALNAIKQVEWLPGSGQNRIEAMVRERNDWCISRQRTWGVPIPVFYERNGDQVLLNAETLAHVRALIAEHGSDVWWEKEEADLLPPAYRSEAHRWRKGTDTMDVWFDSGSSWAAVAQAREGLRCPVDLYLEGSDQHRGWFQSSLLTSVAVSGAAPYRQVLTHGFTLDESGRKMSKSLGNVVDPAVIINGGANRKQQPAYGADVLRLWVSSVDYSCDVPIGNSILRQLADVYRKIRNTARYLLGNLHDFNPCEHTVPFAELPLLDRWMWTRTEAVLKDVTRAFDRYEFYRFFQTLQNFCVVDLSNFYLDIAKDRLYVSAPDDARRRSCQTVLAFVVERLAGMIAPVLCHLADDVWQNIPYRESAGLPESVFERGWPKAEQQDNTLPLSVSALKDLRTRVNQQLQACRDDQQLGSSLEAKVRLEVKDPGLREVIRQLEEEGVSDVDNLEDWLLVSQLQPDGEPLADVLHEAHYDDVHVQVAKADGHKCDRCWHYTTDVGQDAAHPTVCGRCAAVLQRREVQKRAKGG